MGGAMPDSMASAQQLKAWMRRQLSAPPWCGHGSDTALREAFALWDAVVESLTWQRDRQGTELDVGRFVAALSLPELKRRAAEGDVALAAYLARAAGASGGQVALYRARHPYVASYLAEVLVRELDAQCARVRADLAPGRSGPPGGLPPAAPRRNGMRGALVACAVVCFAVALWLSMTQQ